MAQFVNETFTGSNGTNLTSLAWTKAAGATGDFLINANRIYDSISALAAYTSNAVPSSADYEVIGTFYCHTNVTPTVSIAGRMSTVDITRYHVAYNAGIAGGTWNLYSDIPAAAGVVLGSYVDPLVAGETITVKLEMIGTAIKVYLNGVLRISATSSTVTAAGRVGVLGGSGSHTATTGTHIDSVVANDFAPTSGGFPITESFTGTNGVNLNTLSGWGKHPSYTGDFLVQANRVYQSTTANATYYNTAAPTDADYSITGTLYPITINSPAAVGVVGRVSSTANTWYEAVYGATGSKWYLYRNVAGQYTQLGTFDQVLTLNQPYVVKLEMIGNIIRVYVDDVLRIAITDSSPITAKGFAGLKQANTLSTTTTGIHIDTLSASNFSLPSATITYVGVGTAVGVTGPASLTPTFPAGVQVNDYLLISIYTPDTQIGNDVAVPVGWTVLQNVAGIGGRKKLLGRVYRAGVTAPTITTVGPASWIMQTAAFRGVDPIHPVDVIAGQTGSDTSTEDVGPLTGFTPTASKACVIVHAGRDADWTSAATLTGDSLTWNEIAEASLAPQNISLVWDYTIFAGNPASISDKTFDITGDTGQWRGSMISLRPGNPPGTPDTSPIKMRTSGSFGAVLDAKRKAGGSFATKPLRVVGIDAPPNEPNPDPNPTTISAVTVLNEAGSLSYQKTTVNVLSISATSHTTTAQTLFASQGTPPGQQGVRLIIYKGPQSFDDIYQRWQAAPPEGTQTGGNTYTRVYNANDLATLKSWGIDGFTVKLGVVPGGTTSPLPETNNSQRAWNDFVNPNGHLIATLEALPQFKFYLGINLVNWNIIVNTIGDGGLGPRRWSPGAPWFDDAAWNQYLYRIAEIANCVGASGSNIAGIFFDGEEYGRVTGSDGISRLAAVGWWWDRDPTSATEAQVRAKVKERGAQLAATIVNAGGPMEVTQYHGYLPWSMHEYMFVYAGRNKVPPSPVRGSWSMAILPEWLDGISSNSGITALRWNDAGMYKSTQSDLTWAGAVKMNEDAWNMHPMAARPNTFWAPMPWITSSNTVVEAFAYSRDVPYVTEQLSQARAATVAQGGNEILIYGQESPSKSLSGRPPPYGTGIPDSGGYFDYRTAMIAASV